MVQLLTASNVAGPVGRNVRVRVARPHSPPVYSPAAVQRKEAGAYQEAPQRPSLIDRRDARFE